MRRDGQPAGIESELLAIESAAIMDEIAHSVRHDMNNRLASIRNAAGYLQDRTEETELWTSDPRVPRFFRLIDHAVDSAKELLSDRLHVEPLFARRATHQNATEAVSYAAEGLHRPASIRLELELESRVELFIDRGELMLLVVLLLRNSIEAQPEGGTVRIRLSKEEDGALLEVLDDGPWLVDINTNDALLPYATTKRRHLGLGLPIARRIAHRYGGHLKLADVDSRARVRVRFAGDADHGFSPFTSRR